MLEDIGIGLYSFLIFFSTEKYISNMCGCVSFFVNASLGLALWLSVNINKIIRRAAEIRIIRIHYYYYCMIHLDRPKAFES